MITPQIIAGMDEAGRGSWAGPVVAGAVILPKGTKLPGLTDSKLLNHTKREVLFEKITDKCDFGVGIASQDEVDEFGLMHATFKAFERALNQLETIPDHLLIDGRDKFKFQVPHTSIIKGDLKERCISAASIVAKVARDRIMIELDKTYPEYGFANHKGYGTKRHHASLREHGPSAIHRVSYAPLQNLKWIQKELL